MGKYVVEVAVIDWQKFIGFIFGSSVPLNIAITRVKEYWTIVKLECRIL